MKTPEFYCDGKIIAENYLNGAIRSIRKIIKSDISDAEILRDFTPLVVAYMKAATTVSNIKMELEK